MQFEFDDRYPATINDSRFWVDDDGRSSNYYANVANPTGGQESGTVRRQATVQEEDRAAAGS